MHGAVGPPVVRRAITKSEHKLSTATAQETLIRRLFTEAGVQRNGTPASSLQAIQFNIWAAVRWKHRSIIKLSIDTLTGQMAPVRSQLGQTEPVSILLIGVTTGKLQEEPYRGKVEAIQDMAIQVVYGVIAVRAAEAISLGIMKKPARCIHTVIIVLSMDIKRDQNPMKPSIQHGEAGAVGALQVPAVLLQEMWKPELFTVTVKNCLHITDKM